MAHFRYGCIYINQIAQLHKLLEMLVNLDMEIYSGPDMSHYMTAGRNLWESETHKFLLLVNTWAGQVDLLEVFF